MLKTIVMVTGFTVVAAGVATTCVNAQSDAIAQRQQILKGFGAAMGPVGKMLKGDVPYDAAVVQAGLKTLSDGAKKLPTLFPDDSKTGHDTEALPKIWEEKPKFVAIYAKLDTDATAAAASITDLASLRAQMPKVLGNCKTCHDDYRAKK